MNQKQGKHI